MLQITWIKGYHLQELSFYVKNILCFALVYTALNEVLYKFILKVKISTELVIVPTEKSSFAKLTLLNSRGSQPIAFIIFVVPTYIFKPIQSTLYNSLPYIDLN